MYKHFIKLLYMVSLGLTGWLVGRAVAAGVMTLLEKTGEIVTARDIVNVTYEIPLAFIVLGVWIGYHMAEADK